MIPLMKSCGTSFFYFKQDIVFHDSNVSPTSSKRRSLPRSKNFSSTSLKASSPPSLQDFEHATKNMKHLEFHISKIINCDNY